MGSLAAIPGVAVIVLATKRKVTDLTGFGLWRADGTAAFALDNVRLIDPATGAISNIPNGQQIYATVLF
jgi:hypothetical protein